MRTIKVDELVKSRKIWKMIL